MTYKKLFDITYDNKKFTIFIDQNHRRTFLEINEKGEYIYPTLEDFINLNEIYNNKNPNVVCDVKKFIFDEKVRIASGLLSVVIALNSLSGCTTKYKYNVANSSVEISNEVDTEENENSEARTINIKHLKELHEILGYKNISKEEVGLAIDNNTKLPKTYNEAYHELLNKLTSSYPNFDLIVFYENVKTIEVEEFETLEELQAKYEELYGKKGHVGGWYDKELNKIFTTKNCSKEVIFHEMAHSVFSFSRVINGVKVKRKDFIEEKYRGYASEEAMANLATSFVTPTSTYVIEGKVLNYLLNYTSFDYNVYNMTGIWFLREQLMENNPNTDIDYIIDTLDSIHDKQIAEGIEQRLKDYPYLIEELFTICKDKVDLANPYGSYCHFYNYISKELDYLDQYNVHLQSLGCSNIISRDFLEKKVQELKKVEWLAYIEDEGFVPLISFKTNTNTYSYITINKDGNEEEREIPHSQLMEFSSLEKTDYIPFILKYIRYDNFWAYINKDQSLMSPHTYQKTPILYNGKILAYEYVSDIDITLGLMPNGKIGYILSKGNEIIFQSTTIWIRKTATINLEDYIFWLNWIEKIELTDILNDDILKSNFKHDMQFKNLVVSDDNVTIMPSYKVKIKDIDNEIYDLRDCYVTIEQDVFSGPITGNIINIYREVLSLGEENNRDIGEVNMDGIPLYRVYLEDILFYYNMIDENKLEYEFTLEEITDLFFRYIDDIRKELKNDNSKAR